MTRRRCASATQASVSLQRSVDDLREHQKGMEETQAELRASRAAALNLMEDAILARQLADENAAALQESEERYRTLFEAMTEGFALHEIVTDGQGRPCDYRFLEVNPAFERLTGLSRDDLIGKRVREIMPDIERTWIDDYGRVALTGEPLHVERYSSALSRWYEVFAYRTSPGRFAVVFADVTERKAVEEALRESEEQLRLAQAAGGVGTFDWDIVTQVACCSEEYFRVMGRPQPGDGKLALAEWESWLHPADRDDTLGALQAALDGEGQALGEYRMVGQDGQARWIFYQGQVNRDADGRPVRMIGTAQDVTERRRAEEALRRSREDLDRAQEVGQIGSWRLDTRKNVLTWSDESYRIFGVPQGTPLTYESFLATVHPDDQPYVDAQWQAGLRGEPYDIEHRIVVDGQIRWVREKAYLEFDEDGGLLGGFGITQDITDRKQAEERLRESEQRFRTIFDNCTDGMLIADPQSRRFLMGNRAMCKMLGYTPQEIAKMQMADIHRKRDMVAVAGHFEKLVSGNERVAQNVAVRRKDGSVFLADITASPILLSGKRYLTGSFRDVTARWWGEKNLERNNERFRLLSETAANLLASENPLAVVRDLCRKVMKHLDCHAFFNYVVDEKAGRLHLNACAGIPKKEVRKIEWLDYGTAVCGCVARDGERIIAEEIPAHPDARTALVASYGIQAYACHPLPAAGKTIGTLSFGTRTRSHFSAEDVALMKTVADQVAIAMERVRAQQALQESRAQLRQANERLERQVEVKTLELRNTIDQLEEEAVRRVQAEGRLRKSLHLLEGFFLHTITPLAFLDRNFSFVRVNEAYARADGKTTEFFPGKNHFELYPHDENKMIFEEVVRTGQSYRARAKPFSYPDKPWQVTYWDWLLTPLKDERGEVQYLVLNLQDVTHQRVAMDELEHRAFQLQKLTLELSLAEDRERKRMAEILHDDLQQQLAAAKFQLGMLGGKAQTDRKVQEIAAQLDQMLADAIEQSRSLSHDLCPPILYQGDLGETFEWLARQLQSRHGLAVHTEVYGCIDPRSESIRVLLFRAAQEILFNVVKHAQVNEVRLRLQRRNEHLWLTVADRGQGFDPRMLKQTTGLGLLSIRERVQLLGGRMRIRSALGQGSTFMITVPDIRPLGDGEPQSEESPGVSSSVLRSASSRSRLRVLLVDDHKVMREGLAALIARQRDMEIIGQSGDGASAVELARRLRPDVVIIDVAMPVMAGDEATRRIKMEMPQARVIALSMFDEPSIRAKMLAAGAETYLLKVGPSERLLAAIRGD